jgi:predicted HicB family RNase H-like nuclease
MKQMIEHRGYAGRVELDPEAGLFHGEVDGLRDVVTFRGRTFEELETSFRDSVDDYLAWCEAEGAEPERPYSGRLLLRLSPELHRSASAAARRAEKSLNEWIGDAVFAAVRSRRLRSRSSARRAGKA